MLLKLILKIWPALTPILIYFFWVLAKAFARKMLLKALNQKSDKIIEATYSEDRKESEEMGDFSLKNKKFIAVIYLSFFIAIICFLFFAISVPKIEEGQYVPAYIEDGKIIPAKIIKK
ncbi:MAG: type IV secretory pathway TrbL component [Rickettsiales bacterium]|jgi:type IV secretory pathway TrbL component